MDRSALLTKLQAVIDDTLGIDAEALTDSTTFDDLEADSLARLQLVTAVEDEFDITISDEEIEKLHSLGDVLDLLESHQA